MSREVVMVSKVCQNVFQICSDGSLLISSYYKNASNLAMNLRTIFLLYSPIY